MNNWDSIDTTTDDSSSSNLSSDNYPLFLVGDKPEMHIKVTIVDKDQKPPAPAARPPAVAPPVVVPSAVIPPPPPRPANPAEILKCKEMLRLAREVETGLFVLLRRVFSELHAVDPSILPPNHPFTPGSPNAPMQATLDPGFDLNLAPYQKLLAVKTYTDKFLKNAVPVLVAEWDKIKTKIPNTPPHTALYNTADQISRDIAQGVADLGTAVNGCC